ncbi:MAG: hypothetical protein GX911_06745 [Spirochaetales bacterium]|nr:hypothetical protein [Spirochaetales bacterium]
MNKKVGIVAIGIVLLLVACSGSITSELYIRDLLDLAASPDEVFYTQGTVSVESFGSDSDEDLKEMIATWFRDARNFREVTIDFSTYLVADIGIPVAYADNEELRNGQDLLSIVVRKDSPHELDFGIRLDKNVFAMIQEHVMECFYQDLSISDWTFSIDLKNDTRNVQSMTLQTIYANDEPLLYPKTIIVKERETVKLDFPDILRDYSYLYGDVFFGTLAL